MLYFERCTSGKGQSNFKIHPIKKKFWIKVDMLLLCPLSVIKLVSLFLRGKLFSFILWNQTEWSWEYCTSFILNTF